MDESPEGTRGGRCAAPGGAGAERERVAPPGQRVPKVRGKKAKTRGYGQAERLREGTLSFVFVIRSSGSFCICL